MIEYYYESPFNPHGSAIRYTRIDDDGKMFVGNDEYESQVNFCPMTGDPAPKQMKSVLKTNNTYLKGEIIKEYINQ